MADAFQRAVARRKRKDEVMKIMITSLMDMFTIILVFLLFSFSSQDQSFVLEKDLVLPKSTSQEDLKVAINIALTRNELKVEGNVIAKVSEGKILGALKGDKIVPLYNFLQRFRSLQDEAKKAETIVLLQSDKEFKYATVKKIMKTAAMAGYPNFRFAVLKK